MDAISKSEQRISRLFRRFQANHFSSSVNGLTSRVEGRQIPHLRETQPHWINKQ